MEKTKNLTFQEAYLAMKNGKKVARKSFSGYWFIDQETGTFKIHLPERNGKPASDISYGRLDIAIKNTLGSDWYILEEKVLLKATLVVAEDDKKLSILEFEETDDDISEDDMLSNMRDGLQISADLNGENAVCNVYGFYIPNIEEIDFGNCTCQAYIKINKSELSDLSILKNTYI